MRDCAKRQVIGLDTVVRRQLSKLGHERPVATDRTLNKPFMGKPIQSPILAVTGRGCKDEREIARSFGFNETPLESRNQFLGRADADKAGAADHIAVAYQCDGFIGGNDLVSVHGNLVLIYLIYLAWAPILGRFRPDKSVSRLRGSF